jgi:phosphoribosylamine--glycine ligase
VFIAGARLENGRLLTSGGRVLAVSALGKDASDAREKAYHALRGVHFAGMGCRTDIGQ